MQLSPRAAGRLVGILYLVTFATSIPALALKTPALIGPGHDAALVAAIILELVLAVACVGTAVIAFPILRGTGEARALGFVASRTIEAALIGVGLVALVGVTLLDRAATSEGRTALVAVHDAAFLLGPGLLPAVNALLLGTLLYRARLLPRFIPVIGLAGAPLLLASALATLAGATDQVSAISGLAALPIAAWEFLVGAWLSVRGFREPTASPASRV